MGKKKPLPPRSYLYRVLFINFLITLTIVAASLLIGIAGYHAYAGLNFVDSLLNASMILTGMGPVNAMQTDNAKLFASFYALFSGIAFLTVMSIMIAPLLHRFMHKFHIELEEDED
jgi:hypothetical protein